jgi:hypothetical protein
MAIEQVVHYLEYDTPSVSNAIELNNRGLFRLGIDLLRSHGNALIFVHPTYQSKHQALQQRLDYALTPKQRKLASTLKHELDSYTHEVVRLMMAAGRVRLPVIALFELQKDTSDTPTQDRKAQSLEIAWTTLHRYGYTGEHKMYYVITEPETPVSIDDLRHQLSYDEAESALYHRLKTFGLRYAVVGGGYFGGARFASQYAVQSGEYKSDIEAFIEKELSKKRNPQSSFIHPLEILSIHGCVSGALQGLVDAGISFHLARPGTYPEVMPTMGELTFKDGLATSNAQR